MKKDLTVEGTLKNAKKLIEKGWCKFAHAKNKKGHRTGIFNKEASQFCLTGAIRRTAGYNDELIVKVFNILAKVKGNQLFMSFNDAQKSKRPVIALLNKAIKQVSKTK